MKGIRYGFRNFTALAVTEHLRSQVDRQAGGAELTPNEVRLVGYVAQHSERLRALAEQSGSPATEGS